MTAVSLWPAAGALISRPLLLDADAERRGRVVDVEEVAVDAGDRALASELLTERLTAGDLAGVHVVDGHAVLVEIRDEEVTAQPAARVEALEGGVVDAGRDRAVLAAGDETFAGRGDRDIGNIGAADDCRNASTGAGEGWARAGVKTVVASRPPASTLTAVRRVVPRTERMGGTQGPPRRGRTRPSDAESPTAW